MWTNLQITVDLLTVTGEIFKAWNWSCSCLLYQHIGVYFYFSNILQNLAKKPYFNNLLLPYKHSMCILCWNDVETQSFPSRFSVEYTWCVCRVQSRNKFNNSVWDLEMRARPIQNLDKNLSWRVFCENC